MEIRRKTLFESETLQVGLFESRPSSDACGEVERQSLNAIVLPLSGLFAKHEAPGRQVTGTPSHAVYFAPDAPYRISFPGAIGDRAITLRFGDGLAPEQIDVRGDEGLASQGLLSAKAMMLRNLLWRRLEKGEADDFEAEAFGLDLLDVSLASVRPGQLPVRRSALARRTAGAGAREGGGGFGTVGQMERGKACRCRKPVAVPSLPRVPRDDRHLRLRLRAA